MLASASEAITSASTCGRWPTRAGPPNREGVDVRTYSVIYKITEDLRNAMEGLLDASIDVEETVGEVVVKETFKASKVGSHRGLPGGRGQGRSAPPACACLCDGTVVWRGKLASLGLFSRTMSPKSIEGQECGIVLDGYADVKEGDVIVLFQTKQVEQTLE